MSVLTDRQIDAILSQRMVFGAGVVLGLMPLIGAPAVALEGDGTALAHASMTLNCFTLLPASLLAFWWRGWACVWLTLNAFVVVAALFFGRLVAPGQGTAGLEFSALALLLGGFAMVAEVFNWPAVLRKS